MLVYLVRQTQLMSGYDEKTIYVCSTKERAKEYARELNKAYGQNCKFTDEWDLDEVGCDLDTIHYYDVECMEVDENLIILK